MAIPTPVSWWNFNESSGNAADAVASNTLTNFNTATYVAGKINNAVNFVRTSSQYLNITNAAQTGLGITGNMSISLWINLASNVPANTNFALVCKYDYTSSQQSYALDLINNGVAGALKARFIVSSTGSNNTQGIVSFLSGNLSLSTWYHLVAIYDAAAGSVEFYLNGVSQGTATGMFTSIFNSTAPFQVSAFVNASGEYIDGKVDLLGIWNTKLGASDVSSLYNGGAGIAYPFRRSVGPFPMHFND